MKNWLSSSTASFFVCLTINRDRALILSSIDRKREKKSLLLLMYSFHVSLTRTRWGRRGPTKRRKSFSSWEWRSFDFFSSFLFLWFFFFLWLFLFLCPCILIIIVVSCLSWFRDSSLSFCVSHERNKQLRSYFVIRGWVTISCLLRDGDDFLTKVRESSVYLVWSLLVCLLPSRLFSYLLLQETLTSQSVFVSPLNEEAEKEPFL